ncbi:MAG: YHS domain-containing protein [Candidatus Limnocylindrales bacterium]
MELTVLQVTEDGVRAGYVCPCGCTPSVEYIKGAQVAAEGCCCGNHFAVGPQAAITLTPAPGFRAELQTFSAPWGEPLEAAWLIGPSVHGPIGADEHQSDDSQPAHGMSVLDVVCGMSVDPETARTKGLHATFQGGEYFFCGKGCKLEFEDDPERYLDASYVPSM